MTQQKAPASPTASPPMLPGLIAFDGFGAIAPQSMRWIIPLVLVIPAGLIVGALRRDYIFPMIGTCVAIGLILFYARHLKLTRDVPRLAALLGSEHVESPEAAVRDGSAASADFTLEYGSTVYQAIRKLVSWPRLLARALASSRLTGCVLYMGSPYELQRRPIEPLGVPFEPVVLDAADPAFRELAACGRDPAGMKPVGRNWPMLRQLARQLYPMMVASGACAVLVNFGGYARELAVGTNPGFGSFAISILVMLMFLLQLLFRVGTSDIMLAPLFLVYIYLGLIFLVPTNTARLAILAGWVALMGVWWYARRSPRRAVWLMPGGLLLPARREVYRRDSALLMWYPDRLWVIDTKARRQLVLDVSQEEAALAVRAWLSPFPPPSDEMVAAFLG